MNYAELLTPENLADIVVEQCKDTDEFLSLQRSHMERASPLSKIPMNCGEALGYTKALIDAIVARFHVRVQGNGVILNFTNDGELRISFVVSDGPGHNCYYLIPKKLIPTKCDMCLATAKLNSLGSAGN